MMMDTSYKTNKLPYYSKEEELVNVLTHAPGIILGIITIILVSMYFHNEMQLISGILFGLSLIILYTMSCLYHGLSPKGQKLKYKKKFRIVDHCSIPILITGTYIPFALCVLEPSKPGLGYIMLGIVSFIGFVIIVLNIISLEQFKYLTLPGYFLMGGSSIIALDILKTSLMSNGLAVFAAGGLAYGVGTIFYGLGGKGKKWMHSIFHVFCILGSVLHFLCIILYVYKY